jgi:hypothetical protein
MPPLVTRCTDTVPFIAPSDPAVVWPADPIERAKAQLAYAETYDTASLQITGKPVVWHIRPMYLQDMRSLAREAPQVGEQRIKLSDIPEDQRAALASLVTGDELVLPVYHEDRAPSMLCRGVESIDDNDTLAPPVWVGCGERRRLSFRWALSVPPDMAQDVADAIQGLSMASETLKKSSFWRSGKG